LSIIIIGVASVVVLAGLAVVAVLVWRAYKDQPPNE
jgi:hypothetical protein